jgi:exonuclease III
MKTRLASLNANKGTYGAVRRAALAAWIERFAPAVLVLQEPWPAGQEPLPSFGPLRFLAGNSNVAAYAGAAVSVVVERSEDRWVTLDVAGVAFHGVYFPADKGDGRRRAEFLDRLAETMRADRTRPHVIAGDFNFGPLDGDGVYAGKPSSYTSRRERTALEALLKLGKLVDSTRPGPKSVEFTLEREIRGKLSRWRCDLALVDQGLHRTGGVRVSVGHGTRTGPRSFTDHSALIIDLSTEPGRDVLATPGRHVPAWRAPVDAGAPSAMVARPGNTAIRRSGPSAPTAAFRAAYLRPAARVLDFGCAYGEDVTWLRTEGFDATGYDPGERFPAEYRGQPQGQFDAVLMVYVVNVLPPEQRRKAVQEAWGFVKAGGLLFVASRPSALNREAELKGCKSVEDGFWSDERRGMFQRGHDFARAGRTLCAECAGGVAPKAWLCVPRVQRACRSEGLATAGPALGHRADVCTQGRAVTWVGAGNCQPRAVP